jgi:hypothetical protein
MSKNLNPFPGAREMLADFDAAMDAEDIDTDVYSYDSTLGDWEEGSLETIRDLAESEAVRTAEELAEAFDAYTLGDLAQHLTSREADALAAFIAAWGDPAVAAHFLAEHAETEE